MRDLSIGAVFAGHRLEAVLGRGGMGVVYLAMHERLKHRRALKVIAPDFSGDEQFRRRFERESELAASIEHSHVIPIYDAGEDDGQLYIAMRYVEGTDMHELIRARRSLDAGLTALIVTQVASALDAAHARQLVHRDVKPANVLIASPEGDSHSYLTDFGLTKPIGGDASKLRRLLHKPAENRCPRNGGRTDPIDARIAVVAPIMAVHGGPSGEPAPVLFGISLPEGFVQQPPWKQHRARKSNPAPIRLSQVSWT